MTSALNALVLLAPRLGHPARAAFFGRLLRHAQNRSREEDRRWTRLWEGPGDATQFLEMARFYLAGGDLTQAGYHFVNALELRPGWETARERWEFVRRLQGVE
jgi:hypothetical protein